MSSEKPKRILPEADSALSPHPTLPSLSPYHTYKMEVSSKKLTGLNWLNVFTKSPFLDVWRISEFASDSNQWKKSKGFENRLLILGI